MAEKQVQQRFLENREIKEKWEEDKKREENGDEVIVISESEEDDVKSVKDVEYVEDDYDHVFADWSEEDQVVPDTDKLSDRACKLLYDQEDLEGRRHKICEELREIDERLENIGNELAIITNENF